MRDLSKSELCIIQEKMMSYCIKRYLCGVHSSLESPLISATDEHKASFISNTGHMCYTSCKCLTALPADKISVQIVRSYECMLVFGTLALFSVIHF